MSLAKKVMNASMASVIVVSAMSLYSVARVHNITSKPIVEEYYTAQMEMQEYAPKLSECAVSTAKDMGISTECSQLAHKYAALDARVKEIIKQ